MFHTLLKPTPLKLIERELDESQRLLLQSHTNKEHWEAQVAYHTNKIKRLQSTWNKMQAESTKQNGKDKDDRPE